MAQINLAATGGGWSEGQTNLPPLRTGLLGGGRVQGNDLLGGTRTGAADSLSFYSGGPSVAYAVFRSPSLAPVYISSGGSSTGGVDAVPAGIGGGIGGGGAGPGGSGGLRVLVR